MHPQNAVVREKLSTSFIQESLYVANNEKVREFIVTNFLFGESGKLADDTSLLESGIIDSTGILEIVTFIEEAFGITVQDDELLPENLDSINAIVAYLGKKAPQ